MKSFVRTAIVLSLAMVWSSGSFAGEPDPAAALAGADWSTMESVTVTMTEFAFAPNPLVLTEGKPTRLLLRNEGKEAHYFVSEAFFRSIATRKIQGADGEVKAPYFSAVEVYPGKSLEWYLVPLAKGTFESVCTREGHAGKGMRGTIEVRQR